MGGRGVSKIVAVPPILPVPTVEIVVPATAEEMHRGLDALMSGINAGGWATAATVYAWTEPGTGGPRPTASDVVQLSIRAFVEKGIRGLASQTTVRAYRAAWQQVIDSGEAVAAVPGQSVTLPGRDFSFVRPAPSPVVDVIELPPGVYSTIVADPPWDVKAGPDFAATAAKSLTDAGASSRPLIYPTMSIEDILALPVRARAAADAHLYLWTINAYVTEAYDIAVAWGFTPSALLTWCKPPRGIGLGGTYVQTTEHVLFARRGTLPARRRVDTTWFPWPRRDHSVKPIEFFDMVEDVSPGPYLELFARRERPGWDVWGNEVVDE